MSQPTHPMLPMPPIIPILSEPYVLGAAIALAIPCLRDSNVNGLEISSSTFGFPLEV